MKWMLLTLLLCASAWPALPAQAQEPPGHWAWKPLHTHEGVAFKYIFYREGDSRNNGVVVMLVNTNDYAVAYRFKIIFRAVDGEVVEEVSGELKPKEMKTGDAEGLFWVPFTDGREIAEVGLRGYKIIPKAKKGTEPSARGS